MFSRTDRRAPQLNGYGMRQDNQNLVQNTGQRLNLAQKSAIQREILKGGNILYSLHHAIQDRACHDGSTSAKVIMTL